MERRGSGPASRRALGRGGGRGGAAERGLRDLGHRGGGARPTDEERENAEGGHAENADPRFLNREDPAAGAGDEGRGREGGRQ